jgi:hypothetical protein
MIFVYMLATFLFSPYVVGKSNSHKFFIQRTFAAAGLMAHMFYYVVKIS